MTKKITAKTPEIKLLAFEYQDKNWSIFPLTPGEKTPLAKALPGGSQNATIENPLTEEDIERIWTKFPEANIGVHTGEPSQIAVIDIDVAKNDDEIEAGKRTPAQAELLVDQLISLGGETLVHRTPSGGYHLIYHFTPLCQNVGRKINAFKHLPNVHEVPVTSDLTVDLSNIDVLAGNGYIVLPPSAIKKGNKESFYEVVSDSFAGVADFPEDLLRYINRRDKVAKTYFEMKDGLAKPITSDNAKEKKLEAIWELDGKKKLHVKLQRFMGAGAGDRHDALLKTCGTIFAMLPYSEWKNATEYVNMVIETFSPPYFQGSEQDIEADKLEVRNAFNYAKAHEYVDRVHGQEKHLEEVDQMVKTGVETLSEIGVEVTEDEYKEQIEQCFDLMQKDDKGNAIAHDYNIAIILRQHPKYKNRVRYDSFLEQMTYKCKIGTRYEDHYLEDNKDNPALARLMQDIQIDFFPKVPRVSVYSAAVSVAHDAEYDSYRESMDVLVGKWDGEARMDQWLHKVFNCPDDLYHRGVSAQFVFAMVRRAYEPGAEFQKVLFLSAQQGTGKSYSMRILAGDSRYLEFNDEVAGREFALHAKGRTIIDLAEGESMRRTSVQRIKALISDSAGTHRTFGSAEVKDHPVRYVMSITNNDSPLVDNTGNRRFLVVKPPLKKQELGDVLWLKAFRSQIFAEATHKYHEMKRMEKELADEIAQAEEQADAELLYKLYEKQNMLSAYEVSLYKRKITPEEALSAERAHEFQSPFGVALIPQEISDDSQTKARMASVMEEEIQAVLYSYDEYRAGNEEFFITAQEVYNQLSEEVIRQSRLGSFALSECARLITIVDERLERHRARRKPMRDTRGYRFIHGALDADKRLEALLRIRKRADQLKPMPPSQFGGGSKAVTLEQKAARIRWEREGDAYVVIKDTDIDMEVNAPNSVEVASLLSKEEVF